MKESIARPRILQRLSGHQDSKQRTFFKVSLYFPSLCFPVQQHWASKAEVYSEPSQSSMMDLFAKIFGSLYIKKQLNSTKLKVLKVYQINTSFTLKRGSIIQPAVDFLKYFIHFPDFKKFSN